MKVPLFYPPVLAGFSLSVTDCDFLFLLGLPKFGRLFRLVMECYLYYSFYQDEKDANVKNIWETHLNQEIAHLHKAAELLGKYENKQWQQVVPAEFPTLLQSHDTRDYVRQVLASQIELAACKESLKNINDLAPDHGYFEYQNKVNHDVNAVETHAVIDRHIGQKGQDYRDELQPNPVPGLADRKKDNTGIARAKSLAMAR